MKSSCFLFLTPSDTWGCTPLHPWVNRLQIAWMLNYINCNMARKLRNGLLLEPQLHTCQDWFRPINCASVNLFCPWTRSSVCETTNSDSTPPFGVKRTNLRGSRQLGAGREAPRDLLGCGTRWQWRLGRGKEGGGKAGGKAEEEWSERRRRPRRLVGAWESVGQSSRRRSTPQLCQKLLRTVRQREMSGAASLWVRILKYVQG